MKLVLKKLLYFTNGPRPARFSPPCISIETYRPCGGELKEHGEYKDRMNPAGVDLSVLFAEDALKLRSRNGPDTSTYRRTGDDRRKVQRKETTLFEDP
jgi:hypothetical protein